MRLTKITLWNYRSYWSDNITPSAEIDISTGVNYIVGPNNVGKSNLLRAIGLALDPATPFDPSLDKPQSSAYGTQIVLEFHTGAQPRGEVKKLLEYVEAYERTIEGFEEPSLASEGIIRFFVWLHNDERDERFVTRGKLDRGKTRGNDKTRQRAVDKFHEVVRFVDIKSGEDLQSLLQRGFKEVLASALGEGHSKAMQAAENAREAYIEALRQILRPIGKHVEDRLGQYVRNIREVDLHPRVPPVGDALADAQVIIEDAVRTTLEQKGTGVRGAMLMLLLSFIADIAKTAVVFGIEEPESFLHPEAHRHLGEGLERFTQRHDVSLLVTTHSPFIFRSDGADTRSSVFLVRKSGDGRSTVTKDVAETARLDLLGSRVLTALLQKGDEVPESTRLVLVVEGWTDKRFFELASEKLGVSLEGIHLVAAGGAMLAAVQAVALRGMHAPERLVVALFDADDDGRAGAKILLDKFRWKNKSDVLGYDQWIVPDNVAVEAEDIFGKDVMEAFFNEPGNDGFLDMKARRPTTKLWHYGLTKDGKSKFVDWLVVKGTPAMFEEWRKPIDALRKLIADADMRAAKAASHQAAKKDGG